MTEYKFQNAIVRIHGSVNEERLKSATTKFMKKVLKCQKEKAKEESTK